MVKIIDKIESAIKDDKVFYSFEYFPPKTDAGTENLYTRIERMSTVTNPMFIDITWGAGGSTAGKTIEIATTAQNLYGVETQIHMTCTNMRLDDLKDSIRMAKEHGVQNILALRGDPPKGTEEWEQMEGGLRYAKDLIRLVRAEYGDYFGIACAGYPEGHPEGDYERDLQHLKEKVDAGADFVITQLFFDCDKFLDFVKDCRRVGINCPILPGIMPMHTYAGWRRMVDFCKTNIPASITDDLSKLNTDNDDDVKFYGIRLAVQMCKYLVQNGVRGLHLYTLNLEKSVLDILMGMDLVRDPVPRSLPWRTTANAKRQLQENVRPIFWSNRPKSYVSRTAEWSEFPNGRWTDSRSPAFGELSDYHIIGLYSRGSVEERRAMWGESISTLEDVSSVFIKFLEGEIPQLPWVERSTKNELHSETKTIHSPLVQLNERGYWTINSQPRVNAAPSDDAIFGWGPKDGYVFQKAYLEFFTSPEQFHKLRARLDGMKTVTYQAANMKGELYANDTNGVNAVTWGAFPDQEILQPTIVDRESFLVWKDEAFALWTMWSNIYEQGSKSHEILKDIHNSWFLVNIVDNDFVNGDIFSLFDE